MARPSNINKLPENVRAELHAELLQTNFSCYEWLSSWLADKGFTVSKSALQRYAVAHKNEILSLQEESKFHQSHLRLSALNVAAVLSPQKDLGSLKNDADALLKWALFGF